MNQHDRSTVFIIATSICNILISLAIMLGLIALSLFVMKSLNVDPQGTSGTFASTILPAVLIVGLLISMFVFHRFAGWIIRLFHLQDKIDPSIVARYTKKPSDK